MKKNLVIVESPAKAKTIEKYLGRNYKVLASVGHIRDLKKSTMSIDFEKRNKSILQVTRTVKEKLFLGIWLIS